MMRLYIVNNIPNGIGDIGSLYALVSEKGEFFAQHFCSSKEWAIYDLVRRDPARVPEFNERFGANNWIVLYLGDDDMTGEELQKRNQKFYEDEEENRKEAHDDIHTILHRAV